MIGEDDEVIRALGRAGRMLRWQLIASAVTVAAFGIGIRWGAAGVAAAFSLATIGLRYPGLAYLLRGTPVGPRHVAAALELFSSVAVMFWGVLRLSTSLSRG